MMSDLDFPQWKSKYRKQRKIVLTLKDQPTLCLEGLYWVEIHVSGAVCVSSYSKENSEEHPVKKERCFSPGTWTELTVDTITLKAPR